MSKDTKFSTKKIPIKNLSLWDKNSRMPEFLFGEKDRELIQVLLKKYQLDSLANEIVKDFDLPILERIVVVKNRASLVVYEGNRRIATYKCLANPSLIDDQVLRKKFEVLKTKININNNFSLDAVVTSSPKQALRYVNRKHYYRNNELSWGEYERNNHVERNMSKKPKLSTKESKSIFRANIAKKVQIVNLPPSYTREVLGRGSVSNFYRIVDSSLGRRKLRYEKSNNNDLIIHDEEEFLSLLKVIIYNIVKKYTLDGQKLDSRTLNKDDQIEKYLDSISIGDSEEVDRLVASETGKTIVKKRSGQKTQPKRASKTKTFPLVNSIFHAGYFLPSKIKSPKIRSIFEELSKIDVSLCPNATSIMVRILVELTVEEYLLRKKAKPKVFNGALYDRIKYIKNTYIKDKNLQDTVDILLSEDLLTKKLNKVAHNTIFNGTETMIRDLWKNLVYFFDFLIKTW